VAIGYAAFALVLGVTAGLLKRRTLLALTAARWSVRRKSVWKREIGRNGRSFFKKHPLQVILRYLHELWNGELADRGRDSHPRNSNSARLGLPYIAVCGSQARAAIDGEQRAVSGPARRGARGFLAPESDDDVLSIAQLYGRVDGALATAFPPRQPLWVRGEVQTLSDRTGHCYIDLIDPDSAGDRQAPVLKVRCWRQTWGPLRASLARSGIELAPGTVVNLVGRLDFYRARAEVSFVMAGLDVTALLGKMAAERAALVAALREEGLLERNRALPLPDVALSIALVASPDTEGYRDFLGQLTASGYGFDVAVSRASVQGTGAPRAIARAITRCGASGRDLVVIVRGGGSKADMAAFDSAPVARAIATCPVPVWTGIGHTGDESVADIVAHRSFVTPTECGHELVTRLDAWWHRSVVDPAASVARHALRSFEFADRHLGACQGRLSGSARQQLRWHRERLEHRVTALTRVAPQSVRTEASSVTARSARMGPAALRQLADAEGRVAGWRRLLGAFDIERQLERGYTLTMDTDGRVLRSGAALTAGDVLLTRFADATARSVVAEHSGDS
jgi:exodeoxyribonuclease VII large subunit